MQNAKTDNRALLMLGCLGFGIGTCIVLLAVGVLLSNRVNRLPMPVAQQGIATRIPAVVISTRSTNTVVPDTRATRATNALFDQAEKYLLERKPQQVLDWILPQMDQFKNKDDLAEAYYYLGQAEALLGHYQLAAGYFERLYEQRSTVENLMMLAEAYDLGGNLDRALAKYILVTEQNSSDATGYKPAAEQRIKYIIRVIGTPTPKPP